MTQASSTERKQPGIIKRSNSYFLDPTAIFRREGWNPRFDFGEIEELAKSIKANGILVPIRVKRTSEVGKFELIDGDRRLTAVEHLLKSGHKLPDGIPAILEDKHIADKEAMVKMFEANSGKPFLPMEEAEAYRRMHTPIKEGGFGMTLKQISEAVGRNHVHIVDTLRLLQADPIVQEAVRDGKVGVTTAKQIAKAKKEDQKELLGEAQSSKRGTRTKLKRKIEEKRANRRTTTAPQVHAMTKTELADMEKELRTLLKDKATARDWPRTTEPYLTEAKEDAGIALYVTTGIILGIQLAQGKKVKYDL